MVAVALLDMTAARDRGRRLQCLARVGPYLEKRKRNNFELAYQRIRLDYRITSLRTTTWPRPVPDSKLYSGPILREILALVKQ